MKSIRKSITFSSGDFMLKGTLQLPHVEHPPVVIGAHGLFSSSKSSKQLALTEKCTEAGIAFFSFDHRGCGESQGNFSEITSLNGRVNDLMEAIGLIIGRTDTGKQIALFGSSFGGAVAITAASRSDIVSIVTVAAPVQFDITGAIAAIEKAGELHIPEPSFFNKNLEIDISAALPALSNILVFHGQDDDVVPVSHAKIIFEKSCDPKRLIIQENGDHRISNETHQEEFVRESVSWFKAGFEAVC